MRGGGWADLYAWQLDRTSAIPLFRQVYLQIRSAIVSRALAPGLRLPSSRRLASRLEIARASVISAYEQLLAEGYIVGKARSGTFISSDLPAPIESRSAARGRPRLARLPLVSARFQAFERVRVFPAESDATPFNMGRTRLDARSIEAWRKLTSQVVRSLGAIHLGYSDPQGLPQLRQTVCEYLRAARAVRCDPDQIIVTTGTQSAIDLAIRILLDREAEVWVEDPCYPVTYQALETAGVRIRHVPVDAHGMDVRAGMRIAPRARAAFVTASHQFPLGVALTMPRRLDLLAWAREVGAWIIEDDYASEFRYSGRPLASLQGLDDAERTIYVGTLNKALFPGLRLGYMVVPPSLLRAFRSARYLIDRQPSSLEQTVVAEFMRQGHFASHLRRTRLLYRNQRDALVAELARRAGDHVEVDVPDQGMHLIAYVRDPRSDTTIEAAARQRGIAVRAIRPMYKKARPRSGLMLGFSGFSCEAIRAAATRLAKIIESAHP
ncbi:MAG TPA: PLP-dependent aminotransferase family protein [Candidatus Methylomirabilis sp.]|nr:PLP-dependent aminotransferase family protein [Candidatus Methylomirabilis sp.]